MGGHNLSIILAHHKKRSMFIITGCCYGNKRWMDGWTDGCWRMLRPISYDRVLFMSACEVAQDTCGTEIQKHKWEQTHIQPQTNAHTDMLPLSDTVCCTHTHTHAFFLFFFFTHNPQAALWLSSFLHACVVREMTLQHRHRKHNNALSVAMWESQMSSQHVHDPPTPPPRMMITHWCGFRGVVEQWAECM